jgi:transmembrane protein TMEM174 (potassium channel)
MAPVTRARAALPPIVPVGAARHHGAAEGDVTWVAKSRRMSDRWSTSRLEAFSDGMFAIAITLLILEIDVPESGFRDLWNGIADQWPSYLAYATSFITIGGLWLAHHGISRRLASADGNDATEHPAAAARLLSPVPNEADGRGDR